MRRWMLLVLAAIMLGALPAVAGTARPVDAGEWWSWDDPVLVIDGRVLHISVGVPQDVVPRVTMADVTITVPEGVDAKLTASTAPRFPQTARLVRAGTVAPGAPVPVTADVVVNGQGRFDAGLKFDQPSGAELVVFGTSNTPFGTTFVLPPQTNASRQGGAKAR